MSVTVPPSNASQTTATTFYILNLHCPSCITTIESSLAPLQPAPVGITHSIVSHSVTIRHSPALSVEAMSKALEAAGFEVHSVFRDRASLHDTVDPVTPSPSHGWGWGLEQAVQRWSQSWNAAVNADDNRKRKRHVEQCEQCRKEIASEKLPVDSRDQWLRNSSYDPDHANSFKQARISRYGTGTSPAGNSRQQPFAQALKSVKGLLRRNQNDAEDSRVLEEGYSGQKEARLSGCAAEPYIDRQDPPSSEDETASNTVVVENNKTEPEVLRATLAIEGMTCSACVGNVQRAVQQHPWVRSVNVALLSNSATVLFVGRDRVDAIVESIEDVGYDASVEELEDLTSKTEEPSNKRSAGDLLKKNTHADHDLSSNESADLWKAIYSIDGMTCSACVGNIQNALQQQSWVRKADVNLLSNSATVLFEGKHNLDTLKESIEDAGYDANLEEVTRQEQQSAQPVERKVSLRVHGTYCPDCPQRIMGGLAQAFGDRLVIEKPLTPSDPVVKITYRPELPYFTIRHIVSSITERDAALKASVYHPPTVEERSKEMHEKEERRILLRLGLSVTVAIPTFIIGIVFMDLVHHDNTGRRYLMGSIWAGSVTRADWALFFMATVVYFFAADIFHLRTLENLYALWRPGSPVPLLHRFYRFGSMNMLISLGTSIAYFASIAVLAVNATQPSASEGTSSYFDSVVFLTMFLLIGRFLEAKSKAKAGDAVASLGALRPSEAILLHSSFASLQDEDGEPSEHTDAVQERISVDLLEVGDLVRVPHGSSPPYDGVVQHGETRFDESSLTGEARLVSKAVGDSVFSGTTNNGNSISVRLSTVSGTSLLDQIIKVVREGQARRAPVERVADIITSHFVPFVVLVGISTWLIWLALGVSGALPREWLDTSTGGWVFWSLQFSIAVFVIACPCGIGLAAPTALFVGGGLAARNGILVKGGGEAFQEASTLDCVVFDKTGTLTEGGDPSVTQYQDYDCMKTNTALALAKALEEHSSHPLARAIVKYCSSQDQQICIEDVEELPGKGVAAMCQFESTAHNVIIGNEALMADYGVNVSQATIQNWKQQGLSIALLATKSTTEASPEGTDYRLAAAFGISDRIRPEAPAVIQALQSRGVAVWMLSGDNQTTANAVGRSLGIHAENIIAGVLPSEKAEKIKYLQRSLSARKGVMSWLSSRSRATVAMVGDGINDAPALATADVGIAIGSGSDVALSSAHFVLLSSHLDTLLTLIDLSRLVFRRVWFNFGWALVYNLIALPVAAGVLYPIKSNGSHVRLDPAWASLAMALSSVSVVTSSLLLRTSIPGVGFRLESSGSAR